MPSVLTPGRRPLQFILREANGQRSRDNLTILSGGALLAGQLSVLVASTGKVIPLVASPTYATGDKVVLPCYAYNAAGADVMGAFVTRDAELIEEDLIYPAGISGPNKLAAVAKLAEAGLIIRPASYI